MGPSGAFLSGGSRPSPGIGAWIGAALTAALAGVGYLGWKLLGLPFAPFDLFDCVVRVLPGGLVTAGIDTMVAVTEALHLANIGAAAKTAEQTMAIGLTLGAGTIVGAAAFAVLRVSDEGALPFGVVLGAMWGAGAILMARQRGRLAAGHEWIGAMWLLAEFVTWGLALSWSNDRLRVIASGVAPEIPTVTSTLVPIVTDARRPLDRRRFLRRFTGGLTALTLASTACGALAGALRKAATAIRWSDSHSLPNADAVVKPVAGTRPELTPLPDHYRIDADTRPPAIDVQRWRLRIAGTTGEPVALTYEDLLEYEPIHQFITLSCISNPIGGNLIGTTRWTGVSVGQLLPRMRIHPQATHLRIRSADGFWECLALDTVRADARVMLAYAWDGVPLPMDHGFPLRLYVPNLYGMKQPKWVDTIEAIDQWEPGYWVTRGWDPEGQMKTTSAIDAVAASASGVVNGNLLVALGGIAHAGARGISRVEVRLDDGDWHEARLREPLSDRTWVVWRVELTMSPEDHTVSVRGYDGGGARQLGAVHTRHVRFSGRRVSLH